MRLRNTPRSFEMVAGTMASHRLGQCGTILELGPRKVLLKMDPYKNDSILQMCWVPISKEVIEIVPKNSPSTAMIELGNLVKVPRNPYTENWFRQRGYPAIWFGESAEVVGLVSGGLVNLLLLVSKERIQIPRNWDFLEISTAPKVTPVKMNNFSVKITPKLNRS